MRRLRERARRLGWMAVPLAAYVLVTVLLPVLNGAASRDGFARHMVWLAAGCAVVIAAALLMQAAAALTAAARARLTRDTRPPRAGRHGGDT